MEKTYNVKSYCLTACVRQKKSKVAPLLIWTAKHDPHLKEQCMYKLQCSTWVGPPPVPHTLKLALL